MKRRSWLLCAGVFCLLAAGGRDAAAVITYDDNATYSGTTLLVGSGINGGFTVDRENGVELALRGQLRFGVNNHPQNIYNSGGDGTYTFPTGTPDLALTHPDWACETTPVWSVVFSINTDYEDRDDTPATVLSDLTYEMGADFDPSAGTGNWLKFDLINANSLFFQLAVPDHGFGLYSQVSPGIFATTVSDYMNAINTLNIAQNSANYEFINMDLRTFGFGDYSGFDPNRPGMYNVYLAAFSGGVQIARTEIVIVVGDMVNAPDLAGMALAEAQAVLEAAGLTLGAVTEEFSVFPAGTVLSQTPAPGAQLPLGDAVSVVVSKGEAPKLPAAGGGGLGLLCALLCGAGMLGMGGGGCAVRARSGN